ncbi:antibiotic biosynthesis monooxygenase [Bordetella holmesii]|uniref:Antibiotic biosynthesis monooxygenase n=2 Tax=Bordetella holmesii TaxID=35814 RepID=A0A158M3E4_9BORD|nr:antibiotic biosynthesis monooxygenase [Bordetella holmesii]AHV91120.1 antibiotic biosynthesis monooxygenase family protein [Bordetella holmesii ATCC 51541]AIT24786.1 antibiotic biosynthesis monooxygenase family protein [Bordetella holmesii 44057]EWM45355.1 antibiotic biosynthesis monooxygenase family protein [Bordetella holmesii 70147]EWM48496.1 antibiotic biosynthesis monooxygenase family protein [Bordetella holmesii 41130]EWM49471.1 antibiotic biosynthesis monooxygenase family protein [Bo
MSHPVTMLVTRRISPQRYGAFLAWMRQGETLAAGFPGFLGSGVLQPPEGGDTYQIVLRFEDEASLKRWESSLPRRMWLERGASLVQHSQVERVSGIESWFGARKFTPPRWKQAISIWLAYFPMLLLFSTLLNEQLSALPVFWRVLVTTLSMTPVLSFICIPVISRVLHRWLHAGRA